jgi:transposase
MKGYTPVMDEPGPAPKVLIADKGYDSDAIIDDLAKRGIEAVIPAKRNRKKPRIIDGLVYTLRNLVERCFSKHKHSRRLATRYDRELSRLRPHRLREALDQALCQHDLV